MKKFLLPESGKFFKANLHCHTTISDGKLTPEQVKELYMQQGYSIVAFTDHDILLGHPELKDENFLPLHGLEVEINEEGKEWHRTRTAHFCFIALEEDNLIQPCYHRSDYMFGGAPALRHLVKFDENEPDYVRHYSHERINDMLARAREAGFFITYNHPGWSGETYPDYVGYRGMHAMEILNYSCVTGGWDSYCPQAYDDLLGTDHRIFAVAADDNHNVHPLHTPRCDSFGGYVMIKADKLDYRTITKALEAGHFYASRGPEIRALWYEDGEIFVETSPAAKIQFCYGSRRHTAAFAPAGRTIKAAHAPVHPDCGYVRITVTDEAGRCANSSAYFVDDLEA